jgi:hypothetical protein
MTNALMMPRHMASTRPGWQSEEVIEMAPDGMLAGTPPRLRLDDVLDPRGLLPGDDARRRPRPGG